MAEIIFHYEGKTIIIQCNKDQRISDICNNLSNKINTNIDSLVFLYGGSQLNLNKIYNELTKENKINILVYKNENENEICSKCGRILDNKAIDDILSLNNNLNSILIGLKINIDNIINDINNKRDIIYINSQLKNLNFIIKKNKQSIKSNEIFLVPNKNINSNNVKEDIIKSYNNEMICIYDKQDSEIELLHNYDLDVDDWIEEESIPYLEAMNNINKNNISIYIENEKIEFKYKYKSEEKGEIKVKFVFNKLLISTSHMFYECSSLKSINLSSFNSSKVKNMDFMFSGCSSLKSVDLSLLNTSNVIDMGSMFSRCSSLESIDLSSFNTINVNNMSCMFYDCSSLKSIDLSSFDTTNVKNMGWMFKGCNNLKKKNVKFNNSENKILSELNDKSKI